MIYMENTNYLVQESNTGVMEIQDIKQILGQTVMVTKNNAESTAVMLKRLEITENILGGLVTKVNSQNDTIVNIQDRMTELELNEEITEEQANNIRNVVNKRVAEILHFNEDEIAKYFRTFVIKCYSSLKRDNHMGGSYRRTKKRYYQTIIDSIEAWIPREGIQTLKDQIDKRARAKVNAKKNGY